MRRDSVISTLFGPSVDEFDKRSFPGEFFLHHGTVSRLGSLASESLLMHPFEFYRALGINPNQGIVQDASLLHLQSIDGLTKGIQDDLRLPAGKVRCNVICAPPRKGTRKHYDAVEGLTVQLVGSKRWRVERNLNEISPTRTGVDKSSPNMSDAALTFDLSPGSVIFLPRGWWHDTQALELSLSLQFELHYPLFSAANNPRIDPPTPTRAANNGDSILSQS
jgi:hypothetical protein